VFCLMATGLLWAQNAMFFSSNTASVSPLTCATQVGSSVFFKCQTSTGGGATASQTATATNHNASDIIVAYVVVNSGGAPTITVSNSAGGGYTWISEGAVCQLSGAGAGQYNQQFYAIVPSGFSGTDTFTFGASGATYSIGIFVEYLGENPGSPVGAAPPACLDASSGTAASSNAYSTTTGSLAIGTIDCFNGGNAQGSGWTSRQADALPRGMVEDQIVAGGTTTATATCTSGASSAYVFSINHP
jgi:hypothetical protein